jgi:hypothetical protein
VFEAPQPVHRYSSSVAATLADMLRSNVILVRDSEGGRGGPAFHIPSVLVASCS